MIYLLRYVGFDPYNSLDVYLNRFRQKYFFNADYGKFVRTQKMKQRDEIEQPTSCLNKSRRDEPLFVLCARDPAAPAAVREWAKIAEELGIHSPQKIAEARGAAENMEAWRMDNRPTVASAQAAAANKFEGVGERPAIYGGMDEAAMMEYHKREQVKQYRQTAALTAGAGLLVSLARDADGPLVDDDLRNAARAASRFATFLAAEVFPEETGNG